MTPESKKEVLIINKFLTLKENTVPNIAKALDLQQYTVHKVINKYLKNHTINE